MPDELEPPSESHQPGDDPEGVMPVRADRTTLGASGVEPPSDADLPDDLRRAMDDLWSGGPASPIEPPSESRPRPSNHAADGWLGPDVFMDPDPAIEPPSESSKPDRPLPDDAVIGLANEDYEFIKAYTEGKVTEAEFHARYMRDGRVAIPVTVLDPGTPKEEA